jgi:glycosyltransferase involved in cell wall biosynthesis
MANKLRIGLNFFFNNQTNSGIVNYIYNIISALNTLEDDRPHLVVFYSLDAPIEYLKQINYPSIEFLLVNPTPSNVVIRKINSAIRKIFTVDVFSWLYTTYMRPKYFSKIDCLYPYLELNDLPFFRKAKNKIHWLVDFNNRAFAAHYSDGGRLVTTYQERITSIPGEKVVLSSASLFNELKTYYPSFKCNTKILRFASSLPAIDLSVSEEVLKKYKVDGKYFMSPNQFWEHKNQSVVLDAINVLKNDNPSLKFKMLFTGSLEVNRGKGFYINVLRKKIEEYGIEDYLLFLGVLKREEQIILMKNSLALIQPSLYEGWSTLVEEAKALNHPIILSELPVHKEQINENVSFFDPLNPVELASKISDFLETAPVINPRDYSVNIRTFGKEIIQAFTN